MSINNTTWINSSITTYPITDAANGQRFTSGSRISAGHDDDAVEAGLRVNDLFAAQPALVLGTIGMVRLNGLLWQAVTPPADRKVIELLANALAAQIPTDLFQPRPAVAATPAPKHATARTDNPRATAMIAVYAIAKALVQADMQGDAASGLREDLNLVYDQFVRQYGVIHSFANRLALKNEPELLFLKALETNVREEAGVLVAEKTTIFFRPTIQPTPQIHIGSMSPDEALLRCLNDVGRLDLPTIATYTGLSEQDAINALQGRIYCDPATQAWVMADVYLSGDVRQKLAVAEDAAKTDPAFLTNVISLQAVQPTELTPGKIKANLGAPWIPADVVRDFIISLMPRFAGAGWSRGIVQYHAPLAKWDIKDKNYACNSPEATSAWGTKRMDGIEIVEKALNGVPPVVYDVIERDGSEKRIINQKATLSAQEKWMQVRERFKVWVWEDADRAERLCQIYNLLHNSIRRRDFDGSHLLLPGLNRSILRKGDLDDHQKDGIWCSLQQQATLLDLCVGAGKTFIGLAWAHEVKRLGMAKRVMIIAPKNLVEQWGNEANRLYPDMRVMVMAPEDFTLARRGEFLNRIITDNPDVVICAHTSFGFIDPVQCGAAFIRNEKAALEAYLLDQRETSDNKHALKAIAQKVNDFATKLKDMESRIKRDSQQIISWDELQIDALFVDEAQEFKNLITPSMMQVAGVPKGDAKRAFDMRIKTWDILKRGGKVVFATGTPIMNSVGEAFIMMKYLAEALLTAQGLSMFDSWARTFAEVVPIFEMTPDGGSFQVKNRLARFVNMPELFNLWFQFTFSRSREQLGLPTPTLMGGKPIAVSVPPSSRLKAYIRQCVNRVDAIKSGDVDPSEDNILKVISDAGKAALDTRLVFGGEEMDSMESWDTTDDTDDQDDDTDDQDAA